MAIELRRLIEKVSNKDITLVAGEAGLEILVSWVHMVETIEASDFLTGGELVFTTGLGVQKGLSLLEMVKYIYEKNVSGFVVNLGPYIEDIPQDVIDFCNQNSFPLFIVPWRIHLAEIMHTISYALTLDEQRKQETSSAFKNAIFFPTQQELYVVPLSKNGFSTNTSYCVLTITLNIKDSLRQEFTEKLCNEIEKYMKHYYEHFSVFTKDFEIVVVMAGYNLATIDEVINGIKEYERQLHSPNDQMFIGVGKQTKSVRCLYKSYNQACSICQLMAADRLSIDQHYYSNLGLYKLLMSIDDEDILRDYYDTTIKPILDYDLVNKTELVDLLRCYLKNDGSVNKTADEMFVHRNTINYKINKIEEICDVDLSTLNVRINFSVGLMLMDIMKKGAS